MVDHLAVAYNPWYDLTIYSCLSSPANLSKVVTCITASAIANAPTADPKFPRWGRAITERVRSYIPDRNKTPVLPPCSHIFSILTCKLPLAHHPGGMADNSPTFQRWGRKFGIA